MPDPEPAPKRRRPIRSYVLRQGRLTDAQKIALQELWPAYGIEPEEPLSDMDALFGRHAPLVIEIGFGDGEATWRMARDEPGTNFIGIEVHQPGVGHLLRKLAAQRIENVRVVCADAVGFLSDSIPDASLAGARIWFPDPWPKKRHHKRRLIQPAFIELLAGRMAPGAILHIATDWQPYAEHILAVMAQAPGFENLSPGGDYCAKPDWRPGTKYERRGRRLGHEVRDLLFRRIA